MNYAEVGLDLQGLVKRVYANLIYNSTFYNFLNEDYIGEVRQTGTPMIEVLKQNPVTLNQRQTKEIANAITPTLTTYESVKVDLAELPMDYSFRIPVLVLGSGVQNAIAETIRQKDTAMAGQIDMYGYGVLESAITGSGYPAQTGSLFTWGENVIDNITSMKAILFNNFIYDNYRLGLRATVYADLVAQLTSVLKFETLTGVEGVDRGVVAKAYGVDIFPINDLMLRANPNTLGYFANPVGVVGDAFFDSMVQYNGNYPGFPGYFVVEGNILFGAKVVRPEAVIKIVDSTTTTTTTTE